MSLLNDAPVKRIQQPQADISQPPIPVPQPQAQPKVESTASKVMNKATAGLGWIGEQFAKPSEWTEKNLTGGQGYEKKLEDFGIKNTKGQLDTNDVISTAGRFVLDPFNLIGVGAVNRAVKGLGMATKVIPTIQKIGKAIKGSSAVGKITKFARETPAIYKVAEKFDPFFRNPEIGRMAEAAKQTADLRTNNLFQEVSQAAKGLTKGKQARIGQLLEGGISTAKTEPRLVEIANQFRTLGEQIGKELVDNGLLKPEQFAKYKGAYMHHMWQAASEGKSFLDKLTSVPTISGKTQMFRKGAEGYIKEFAAPTFAGLGSSIKDIESAKFYKGIAEKFGAKTPEIVSPKGLAGNLLNKLSKNTTPLMEEKFARKIPKGFSYAPETLTAARGAKVLKDVALPQEVIDILKNYQQINQKGVLDKAVDLWKVGKTIINPAYHARNVVSNQILSWIQTGDLATVPNWIKSVIQFRGGTGLTREATEIGLIKRKAFGEGVKELAGEVNKGLVRRTLNKPMEFQSMMEDTAKLNVYTFFRKKGLDPLAAKAKAEEAIFSPYRISQAERNMIGKFVPFYSFFRQAAPFISKRLVTNPERFAPFVKAERALESSSEPDNESLLPDYMKGMVRTPLKNKEGQKKYLSTQYMYPWGGFISDTKPLLGLPLGLGVNPLLEEFQAQQSGEDPYFKSKFLYDTDTPTDQAISRLGHARKTFAPTLANTAIDKWLPSMQGRPDTQGRERSGFDLGFEQLGVKTYPFSPSQGARQQAGKRFGIMDELRSRIRSLERDQSKTPQEKAVLIRKWSEEARKKISQ